MARIEGDGIIYSLQQIKVIPPSEAGALLKNYKIHGSGFETLVASIKAPDLMDWHITDYLPCILTKENADFIKSVMTTNDLSHYICTAQTQMLIGTTSVDFYKAVAKDKYALFVEEATES